MIPEWRSVKWGQVGNLIAWGVSLAGTSQQAALIWGIIITLIATIAAG